MASSFPMPVAAAAASVGSPPAPSHKVGPPAGRLNFPLSEVLAAGWFPLSPTAPDCEVEVAPLSRFRIPGLPQTHDRESVTRP